MNTGVIELQTIQVDNSSTSKQCECWSYNVAEQFSVIFYNQISGNAVVEVGNPHEGYSIEATVVNGNINDKSKILSPDKVMIPSFVFVDGIACGPWALYDKSGLLLFNGYFKMESGKDEEENMM